MTLKNDTLRYLRELAKKHLGRGHQRLKTREEILQALRKFLPAIPGLEPEEPRAQVIDFEKERNATVSPPAPEIRLEPEAAPAPEHRPAEPVVEGFFVARVQGEDEARRHHLTAAQVPPPLETGQSPQWLEHLADIPWSYGDDRLVLLCRDPLAAHAYWDVSAAAREEAFDGLRDPRAVLKVFDSGHEIRAVDVALESRSWYLTALAPGRRIHVELHAVGADGQSRRIGPASNEVTLPPDDISADTTVRFMRVDWDAPLNRLKDHLRTGRISLQTLEESPEPLELVYRRWVPLPTSGSWMLVLSKDLLPRAHWVDQPLLGFPSGSSSFALLGHSGWLSSRGPIREGSGS
jgi:hypothetical protein